ncbi:MAG: ABC transporter permease [Sphaerochaetaceae bacterium]|nr:ABC transporter permease [Sphaerochaetaceae bacterium]NLV83415.1 ABC transporter permease [Spirochaetales bacterium]
MMRDAMIIFRKEIRGLLKDRRTLFSSLILPILIVPIIFLGMGSVLGGLQKDAEESVYSISIKGIEDPRFATTVTQFLQYSAAEDDSMADMMVIFPPGYRSGAKASVQLVYDSSSQKNQYAASQLTMAVNAFDQQLTADKLASVGLTTDDLNSLSIVMVDTAPQEARSGGSMLAMLMPYFLIIFLFAGSMSSGLDVTAGEKERGSLAAILVNQVSRTSIAMGKILHVMVVSISSALATFLGLVIALSFPNGGAMFGGAEISAGLFSISSLLAILLGLVSAALFTATVVSLLGCLAKTVKEANTYVMPLYLVVVFVGVSTMYMDPSSNIILFFIPYVNIIFTMKEAFLGIGSASHLLIATISNLVYAAIGVRVVSALFNSERILQTV